MIISSNRSRSSQ